MVIAVVIPTLNRPSLSASVGSFSEADEIYLPRSLTKTVVEQTNEAIAATHADIIVSGHDRMIMNPGWRTRLEECFSSMNNSGVVSFFHDCLVGGAATRDFITHELKGYMFHPDYSHYFADQELVDHAKRANKYTEMLNWYVLVQKTTPTNQLLYEKDRDVYEKRKSEDYP